MVPLLNSYLYIFTFTKTEQLGGSSEDHFSLVFHVLDTESNEHTAQSGNNRLGFGLTYEVVVFLWVLIYQRPKIYAFMFPNFPVRIIIFINRKAVLAQRLRALMKRRL